MSSMTDLENGHRAYYLLVASRFIMASIFIENDQIMLLHLCRVLVS